jgi:hypothetical protein
VIPGGAVTGAAVRDIRLANELADRGHSVHVWWALDWNSRALRPSIRQHWLFHGLRFAGPILGGAQELAGRAVAGVVKDKNRAHLAQQSPVLLRRIWHGLVRRVCSGVESDGPLLRRFASQLRGQESRTCYPRWKSFARGPRQQNDLCRSVCDTP